MDDEEHEDRRRRSPGRRAEDFVYDALNRRMERFEDRFEKAVEKLESTITRLEQQIFKTEDKVHRRVDQLEGYHIEEQASVRTRVADRTRRMEKWQIMSITFGVIGVFTSITALVLAILFG